MRPVTGCASTSSGRSIGVAPSKSAARRVSMTTSAWLAKPLAAVRGPWPKKRQPAHLTVGLEPCDVQRAFVEQVLVGLGALRVVPAAGDELVDILHPLVVAGVHRDAAVGAERRGGALMLETPERGALDRRGRRGVRIDL